MKNFYSLMSWMEARDAAAEHRVVILPIGTVDANGPLTPLGFDYLVSTALAEQAAERTGALWMPGIAYGVSEALDSFSGTISMPPEHLAAQVDSIVGSLIRGGFTHILLINNHGPNQYPVEYALRRIRRRTGVLVPSINPAQLSADLRGDIFGSDNSAIGHGSEPGVSLLMHLHPGSVDLNKAKARPKSNFQNFEVLNPMEVRFGDSRVNMFLELSEVSATAGWGDPTQASAEKGEALFNAMLDFVVDFIPEFQKLDTKIDPPEVSG